jgi:hypothetical protein
MNLRREPTYLSSDVWKACLIIARYRSSQTDGQGLHRTTSVDEIAVELLRGAIKDKYPQLLAHQKKVEKEEEELIQSLEAK